MTTPQPLNSAPGNAAASGNSYPEKSITETLSNGFFSVNKNWEVQYWNKAAEKIFGISSKDIVGMNLRENLAGALPQEFLEIYQKAFLDELPVHFEEHRSTMGDWFDVITYYSDEVLSVSFKSRKFAQTTYPEDPLQRLHTLTEHYKFVTEITHDALWEWDFSTEEILWIDGGHKRLFGYPIENALIPKSFWESRVHPEDRAKLLARLQFVIATGKVSQWEYKYRFARADGTYAHVHDRGHIIYAGGKALRMIGASQDITQKVLLEQKAEEGRLVRQGEITRAVLGAQEKERTWIGYQLQENLSQMLVAVNMYLSIAKRNANNREVYLQKSSGFVTEVIDQIRKMHNKLVIPDIAIAGLFDNIRNLAKDTAQQYPLRIELFKDNIDENQLSPALQLSLYRVIQEQVNNILQHSGANNAVISLSMKAPDTLLLLIKDNGIGWDSTEKTTGLGLSNISTRLALFNGEATVESGPGKGFTLKAVYHSLKT